jgi:two-component sensor histidine kinase
MDRSLLCGFIVNELVANSVKHAFPGGRRGRISVELARLNEGMLRLRVADDGVGIPAFLNVRETTSQGLALVDSFARQLEGKLTLENDRGAVFVLDFPETTAP